MPFKTELEGRYLGQGVWELTKPLEYHTMCGRIFIVPVGEKSDGASIPRVAWFLIGSPWSGKYGRDSVLHDYLCRSKIVTRARADSIFLESMQESNVAWWRRNLMYLSVRIWGMF